VQLPVPPHLEQPDKSPSLPFPPHFEHFPVPLHPLHSAILFLLFELVGDAFVRLLFSFEKDFASYFFRVIN
jgi:hypothetical protein